jgi:hypothetical protein
MQQRPSPEEVTHALKTTSDKIRALAKAGYDRTEISKHLGVRYQHVRKVLLDAGISDGLRRKLPAGGQPAITQASAPPVPTSWEVLLRAGFQFVGEWTHDPESVIKLDATAPQQPGVYAFIVDDIVQYVGLTNDSLRTCLHQYRRGHEGQRTRARVKKLIGKTLSDGKRVKILVATPEPLQWNGLPVNTAAGLEAGLIDMIRPAWNITGAV